MNILQNLIKFFRKDNIKKDRFVFTIAKHGILAREHHIKNGLIIWDSLKDLNYWSEEEYRCSQFRGTVNDLVAIGGANKNNYSDKLN